MRTIQVRVRRNRLPKSCGAVGGSMSCLEGRLRKLEAQLIDRSGLVPHTKLWWEYWTARVETLLAGKKLDKPELIPLEFIDALLAATSHDHADNHTSA